MYILSISFCFTLGMRCICDGGERICHFCACTCGYIHPLGYPCLEKICRMKRLHTRLRLALNELRTNSTRLLELSLLCINILLAHQLAQIDISVTAFEPQNSLRCLSSSPWHTFCPPSSRFDSQKQLSGVAYQCQSDWALQKMVCPLRPRNVSDLWYGFSAHHHHDPWHNSHIGYWLLNSICMIS